MKIAGLATGMDLDQIVRDLMRAQRLPIDKMMQTKQSIQWKTEGYREINRKLDTFRNNIFDGVIRQANMLAKSVTSSNESKVSATASSSAGNMSLRIGAVTQLAKAASYSSNGTGPGGISIDENKKISASVSLGSQSGAYSAEKKLDGENWSKKGVVHRENVQQKTSGNVVTLGKDIIGDGDINSNTVKARVEDTIVKINGKTYNITTDKTEFDKTDAPDNLVYLEKDKLEFKHTIEQGTTVSTVYMTESEKETFQSDPGKKTFQVQRGGLDLTSLEIKGDNNKIFTATGNGDDASPKIITNGKPQNANEVFVNLDTGQVEFFGEQRSVTVDYKQSYTTAQIDAKNANGPVSDKFIFTANQSLNQIFTEMNRSSVGVSGFYDEYSDKVIVSRTETGLFNTKVTNGPEIEFGGFFTNVLKLNGTDSGGAQNAEFTLNGIDTQRQSNTFTVAGMTVSLKGTTTEETTLSSSTNTDKVFDTIKAFVDEYNELLGFVNGKLTEDRHREYKPLTDDEREALSDKEVEKWEEKAKSGLLRNDSTLRSPFDKMRVDMYSSVSGDLDTQFRQLSSIGITTTSDYMARGKLEINEDKLRAAIESDPEGVYQLFAADGDEFGGKGIARRARDTLDSAISSLAEQAGGFRGKITNEQFTLGRKIDSLDNQISNFERRMKQVEARYWRQFNAMDAAVQRANQQAESLFSQLSGGNQGQ